MKKILHQQFKTYKMVPSALKYLVSQDLCASDSHKLQHPLQFLVPQSTKGNHIYIYQSLIKRERESKNLLKTSGHLAFPFQPQLSVMVEGLCIRKDIWIFWSHDRMTVRLRTCSIVCKGVSLQEIVIIPLR